MIGPGACAFKDHLLCEGLPPERALYSLGTLLRRVPAVAFQADPHPLATAAL